MEEQEGLHGSRGTWAKGQRLNGGGVGAVFWSSGKNYDSQWVNKTAQNERKGKVAYFELSKGNQNNIQSSQTIYVLRNWNLHTLTTDDDKEPKEIQIFFNWIVFCCLLYIAPQRLKRACLLSISQENYILMLQCIMQRRKIILAFLYSHMLQNNSTILANE